MEEQINLFPYLFPYMLTGGCIKMFETNSVNCGNTKALFRDNAGFVHIGIIKDMQFCYLVLIADCSA